MLDLAIFALFALSGFIAGASVAHSLRGAWRAWRALMRQPPAGAIQPMSTSEKRLRKIERRSRKG